MTRYLALCVLLLTGCFAGGEDTEPKTECVQLERPEPSCRVACELTHETCDGRDAWSTSTGSRFVCDAVDDCAAAYYGAAAWARDCCADGQ